MRIVLLERRMMILNYNLLIHTTTTTTIITTTTTTPTIPIMPLPTPTLFKDPILVHLYIPPFHTLY
jgi:hypothetical protein